MMNKFFSLSIIYAFFIGCSTTNSVTYNYESNIGIMMHPNFKIYHHKDSNSKLFFKLSTNEILYTRNERNQPFEANIILKYSVYNSGSKDVLDSGTLFIEDKYSSLKSKYVDTILDFSFNLNNVGRIELNLFDVNRSRNSFKNLTIDKTNLANSQFFMFTDTSNNNILENHFHKGQTIYISSDFHKDKKLYAQKNNTEFPLPAPPFSKSTYPSFLKKTSPAQLFQFNYDDKIKYTFPEKGFVYFQLDTTSEYGFTLFNFHEDFPLLKDASNLISPLRYLTSKDEYGLILAESKAKNAVDRFWLSKTNSIERSRTLIRTYYSRVQFANELFTSHIEGWKTDRGLISIIFGSPNYVRNNRNYETWIYGNDHNSNTIKFTFEKIKNPFSENDYVLKRNYAYKTPWYRAVETWRSGKVYWVQ